MTIRTNRREILKYMGATIMVSTTPAIADGKHTDWQIAASGETEFKSIP